MELTLSAIILFSTTLLTGLSAGLFYAWQVSVIPGTKQVSDTAYLETMQLINRKIINPFFILIFLGSFITQLTSLYLFADQDTAFWILFASTLSYTATLGITGAGNVPLNNDLDKVELPGLNADQKIKLRIDYESPWNLLHLIRTVFSLLSFVLLLLVVFTV
jgi:uncharacterized membrane protein